MSTSSPRKKEKQPLTIIGTTDRIDFPDFDIVDLPCKIDTGAETSSIHCHRIKLVEREGLEWLQFRLLDPSHDAYRKAPFSTTDFEERIVRSSSGHASYRYVIQTHVLLFGRTYYTPFTLADREQMRFPVLLGKSLLKRRFLVDVSEQDLSFGQKGQSTVKAKEKPGDLQGNA